MSAPMTACPGCGAQLPASDGAVHRYIGASAACWELFSALNNAGEPPLAPAPLVGLLPDAYAAHHPGVPSPQAVQSVAVHLLVLYGVLVRARDPSQALWLRQAVLRGRDQDRQARFTWLTPPDLTHGITVATIVAAPTPQARTALVERYVVQVWEAWTPHHATVAAWYDRYAAGT